MSDFEEYKKHFPPESKVIVAIPMRNKELFRDDAYIQDIDDDLVSLQLSRDVLPVDINLQTGKTLELRGGKEGYGFRCSGNLVSEGTEGVIIVRLTGDINSSEQREYYRIEAFLPLKYQVCRNQGLDVVIKEWRARREKRIAEEAERREQIEHRRRQEIFRIAEQGRLHEQAAAQEVDEFDFMYPAWGDVNAVALNLSGGGFKFVSSDHFELGDIVLCEIFIPNNPPRIMDCVTRVVFKNRNYAIKGDEEFHNIALQFMFLEERDRDALVSHISKLQLVRIGMARQRTLLTVKDEAQGGQERFRILKMAALAVFVLGFCAMIGLYFVHYSESHVKNDIQQSFEDGINAILQRFK